MTVAATAMGSLLALLPPAGHDQMWLLCAADLVRHGAKLYGPQLFESNPPLIVWLSMLPSALAVSLHLPATAIGKLLVSGGGAVIAICWSGCCDAWVRSRFVLDERCQDPPSTARCSMTDTTICSPGSGAISRFRDELGASIPTFRSDPLSSAVQSN